MNKGKEQCVSQSHSRVELLSSKFFALYSALPLFMFLFCISIYALLVLLRLLSTSNNNVVTKIYDLTERVTDKLDNIELRTVIRSVFITCMVDWSGQI